MGSHICITKNNIILEVFKFGILFFIIFINNHHHYQKKEIIKNYRKIIIQFN